MDFEKNQEKQGEKITLLRMEYFLETKGFFFCRRTEVDVSEFASQEIPEN